MNSFNELDTINLELKKKPSYITININESQIHVEELQINAINVEEYYDTSIIEYSCNLIPRSFYRLESDQYHFSDDDNYIIDSYNIIDLDTRPNIEIKYIFCGIFCLMIIITFYILNSFHLL